MASWVSVAVCGAWLVTQATAQTTRELNSDPLSHSSTEICQRRPCAITARQTESNILVYLRNYLHEGTCTRRLNAMRRCAFLHVRGCEAQTPVQRHGRLMLGMLGGVGAQSDGIVPAVPFLYRASG